MILDTNKIEEKALANFKGGEKALNARMHVDENNKIILTMNTFLFNLFTKKFVLNLQNKHTIATIMTNIK